MIRLHNEGPLTGWTQQQALEFCEQVELFAPLFGYHVALTGGCLYKAQEARKDLDIVFYRHSDEEKKHDQEGLLNKLAACGVYSQKCSKHPKDNRSKEIYKGAYMNRVVDIFFV